MEGYADGSFVRNADACPTRYTPRRSSSGRSSRAAGTDDAPATAFGLLAAWAILVPFVA
jgi:hypothetical protein